MNDEYSIGNDQYSIKNMEHSISNMKVLDGIYIIPGNIIESRRKIIKFFTKVSILAYVGVVEGIRDSGQAVN